MKKIISSLVAAVMTLGVLSVTAVADSQKPTIVTYVPGGITVQATDFDAETSRHHSMSVSQKTVAVDQESSKFDYQVTTEAGLYDLYAFYSTREGTCNMKILVDGELVDTFEVPESMGWIAGTSYIRLATLNLTEGEHVITFTYQKGLNTNLYYLENFTLVHVDEKGNVIYDDDENAMTYEPRFVEEIPAGISVPATSFDPKTSTVQKWAVKEKTVTVTRDSNVYNYNVDIDKTGVYDLYAFYSTRAGTVNMVFSVDGVHNHTFELPEAKGWAYAVGKIKLKALELTEGKHTITFAFDESAYKYYFLENFALVPRENSGLYN